MKLLFVLFFLSSNAFAGFIANSKFNKCFDRNYYAEEAVCEKQEGEKCSEVNPEDADCEILKLADVLVDDLDKPIWGPITDAEVCIESGDPLLTPICSELLESKICSVEGSQKFINQDFTQVYCTKITGYEQKVIGQKIEVDQIKKADHLAKIEKDKKDKEDAKAKKAADKIKAKADIKAATTIAQLRKAMEDYIESSEP